MLIFIFFVIFNLKIYFNYTVDYKVVSLAPGISLALQVNLFYSVLESQMWLVEQENVKETKKYFFFLKLIIILGYKLLIIDIIFQPSSSI